jgi:formylglycine-generating enzyme required for sulfatase activity
MVVPILLTSCIEGAKFQGGSDTALDTVVRDTKSDVQVADVADVFPQEVLRPADASDASPDDALDVLVPPDDVRDVSDAVRDVSDTVRDAADAGVDTGWTACTADLDCVAALGEAPGPCFVAACHPQGRYCFWRALPNGSRVESDDPCVLAAYCQLGQPTTAVPRECDDGNPCTDDHCEAGTGCTYTALTGAACDDANACSSEGTCLAGICVSATNTCPCNGAADCAPFNDDNLCNGRLTCEGGICVVDPETIVRCPLPETPGCTRLVCQRHTGSCEPAAKADGSACEDGNACTVGDACDAGQCVARGALDCDDGNDCSAESCGPALGCAWLPLDEGDCSDGDPCTAGDACVGGYCQGERRATCACVTDGDCLGHDDADLCTGNLRCDDGFCAIDRTSIVTCAGGTDCGELDCACTRTFCDSATGACTHAPQPDGRFCSDADACTLGEYCAEGRCEPGLTLACDDGNTCTLDRCDPARGCVHEPTDAPCDDGVACTRDDVCAAGACSGAPYVCEGASECTESRCLGDGTCSPPILLDGYCDINGHGCVPEGDPKPADPCLRCAPDEAPRAWSAAEDGSDCSDGDACTENDTCDAGVCAGTRVDCDDDDACTADGCDVGTGCTHDPVDCDDQVDCTTDGCDAISGCTHGPDDGACDDQNVCTVDRCDAELDCQHDLHALDDEPCDDGLFCTLEDRCGSGTCAGTGSPCVGACLTGVCGEELAGPICEPITDGTGCDDGDLDTAGDACFGGACLAICGAAEVRPCVAGADDCEADCGDDDACNGVLACVEGACVVAEGSAITCEEPSEPCRVAICDPATGGCSERDAEDGAACDDGDLCSEGDACADGFCAATPVVCGDDGNPCTEDVCDDLTGFCGIPLEDGTPVPDDDLCDGTEACLGGAVQDGEAVVCTDDGNPCTTDVCDPATGACGGPVDVPTSCDDGDPCTEADACVTGVCQGTIVPDCDASCDTLLACGGTCCPPLPGYVMTCNPQAHCEYGNEDRTGWRAWDVWIYVPPGSFDMGAVGTADPVHTVTFAAGFFFGKYEVTVSQYAACQALGDCTATGSGNTADAEPRDMIEWQQARDVCGWLGGRLPSEAEWEHAAKGPTQRLYPWGDAAPSCELANYFGCGNDALPVGSKPLGASWCGALDMAGNLWEWVEDWWHADYTGAPTDGSAWVDPTAMNRVRRGGAFGSDAPIRSAYRNSAAPTDPNNKHNGARCALDLPCAAGEIPTPDGCTIANAACTGHADGVFCQDGDPCTDGDTCLTGVCVAGPPTDCDDSEPCTMDACGASGCAHEPRLDGSACDDENPLTTDDACLEASCIGLPDPDGDEVANDGHDVPCATGTIELCNDNCPDVPNSDQADANGNGRGDACIDCGDGFVDGEEDCDDGNAIEWDGCTRCEVSEFQVNLWTAGNQREPSVSVQSSGPFLIVWTSWNIDGKDGGVYAQRFRSDGVRMDYEFRVNQHAGGDQSHPDSAFLGGQRFVVVWRSASDDGVDGDILARIVDFSASEMENEFRVNMDVAGDQSNPTVAARPGGGFAVAWDSEGTDGDGRGVYCRHFDSAGQGLALEYQVNTTTTGYPTRPAVAFWETGDFLIAWSQSSGTALAQRFDATGARIGPELYIAGCSSSVGRCYIDVASLSDGRFLATYVRAGSVVMGRIFSEDEGAGGEEFPISTFLGGTKYTAKVASWPDDRFVAVWTSYWQDGSFTGAYGRVFDAAAQPSGAELAMNRWTEGEQRPRDVDVFPDGSFVSVWTSQNQDGDGIGVFARLYRSDGSPLFPCSCPGDHQWCDGGACRCVGEACGEACCGFDDVCVDGACCLPYCGSRECGDDGCGGTCGTCGAGTTCVEWTCV